MDLLFMCHRKEGDPDRTASFGEHMTTSFLYWGGADGLQPDRRLEIPTEGVHNDYGVDLGNIRNRRYEFAYVSAPHHRSGLAPSRLSWKGQTPHGSRLVFQLRGASSREALDGASWSGHYETSGAAISGVSGAWIQYRVRFLSPDGVNYPALDEVAIEFR